MVSQLILLLALTAEPTTATLLVRRTGVPATESTALARQVSARLAGPAFLEFTESQKKLSMFGLGDGTTCGGKSECHAEVGRQLGVAWLVLVSVSQIAQDQSLALELFEVATEKVHERESILLPRKGEVPPALLETFAALVTKRVQPRPTDAPVETTLVPDVKPRQDPLPEVPQPPKSHVTGLVLGAAALVALGAGVGLLVNGLNLRAAAVRSTLGDDGRLRSDLTGSQAGAMNDAASVQYGIAGGAAAAGLALGAAAVVTW